MNEIKFYRVNDPYGEFSNFSSHPILVWGEGWKTVEHFYQAMKFTDDVDREAVKNAQYPGQAARIGRDRSRSLRPDWEGMKDDVMRIGVSAKFEQHKELRTLLVDTDPAVLIEHTSNDNYWADGGDGSGKNMLGKILMEVRVEWVERKKQLEEWEQLQGERKEKLFGQLIDAFNKSVDPCSCGSKRFLRVNGKAKDLGTYEYASGHEPVKEHDGYAPEIEGVCEGDYICITICCDCSKVQGAVLDDESLQKAFKGMIDDEDEA